MLRLKMRSLATKLTLAFLLVGLTGAILVAIILQVRTRSAFDQFVLNRDQQSLVDNLVTYYQANGSWKGVEAAFQSAGMMPNMPRRFRNMGDPRQNTQDFTLVGPDHTVLVGSGPGQAGRSMTSEALDQAVALKINSETIGWLILPPAPQPPISNSPEAIFLDSINRATLLSGLVAVILALALGGFLAYTLTRSLRELTQATEEIAGGRFGRQVKVRSKDELGELAASFNQMSQDLERATGLRRQMTADIAHDLRTPLSVIAGYAEALSDGKLPGTPDVYTVLNQETQHLSRMVDDLRTLSLADAGELPLMLQATNPRAFLERVRLRHAVSAQQRGINLRVEAGPDLPEVAIDAERMAQVFDNLVSNAFRYTPQGGEVILAAGSAEKSIFLQVRDNGQGIDPQDLPNIFDRFYRGDQARSQTGESGLGLAIAKSIVEAHGGTLEVESTPGMGATFTIRIKDKG